MNQVFDQARARAALAEAFAATLGEMAFLDAREVELPAAQEGGVARAAIDALKPASCTVELRARRSFLSRIASILFPEGSEAAGVDDAVLEILNVATGRFLTGYFGAGREVKLELPRFVFPGEEEEATEIASFALDVEGEIVAVSLSSVRYRY